MPSDTNGTQEVKTTEESGNTEELQANARSQLEQLLTLVRTQTSNTAKTSCEADIRSMISDISSATPTELLQMVQEIRSLEAVVDAMTDNNASSKSNTVPKVAIAQDNEEETAKSDDLKVIKTILIACLLENILNKNPELLQTITQKRDDSSPENNNIAVLLNALNISDKENLTNNIKSLGEDEISKLTDFLAKIIETPSTSPEPEGAQVQAQHPSRGVSKSR
jgi:hypothetical protein